MTIAVPFPFTEEERTLVFSNPPPEKELTQATDTGLWPHLIFIASFGMWYERHNWLRTNIGTRDCWIRLFAWWYMTKNYIIMMLLKGREHCMIFYVCQLYIFLVNYTLMSSLLPIIVILSHVISL